MPNRELIQSSRPTVCTGATPDGWLTRKPGDVTITAYRTADGSIEYDTTGQGI